MYVYLTLILSKDIIARVVVSNAAIIMLIVLCAIVIDKLRHESYVAIVISLINALIPQLSKIINGMEKHYNETMSQISLYIKISIFRWTNTGKTNFAKNISKVLF